jgi:hypothetical protein
MLKRIALGVVLVVGCNKSKSTAAPPPKNDAPPVVTGGAIEVSLADDRRSLVVVNKTGAPVRLQRDILVQHKDVDVWVPIDTSNLVLREQCDAPGGGLYEPPACVEIAAGATFQAAPWTGDTGDAQCACEECSPAPPGPYKMGVTPCESDETIWTAVFQIGKSE